MTDLQAIDTEYNGYLFRSRLEARWAIFLDAIGAEYQYEPQGYSLPSGWYLPDFHVPKMQAWLEIKPTWEAFDARHQELADISREHVIVVMGDPWPGEYCLHLYGGEGVKTFLSDDTFRMAFATGRKDESDLWLWAEGEGFTLIDSGTPIDKEPLIDAGPLVDAFRKARQARFEHGAYA